MREHTLVQVLAQQMLLAAATAVLFVGLLLLNDGHFLLHLISSSPQAFVPLALLTAAFVGLFGCAMFASALEARKGTDDLGGFREQRAEVMTTIPQRLRNRTGRGR